MTPNPQQFLEHLQSHGYHPRSDKHSNALARTVVQSLVTQCPLIAERLNAGSLVFNLNQVIFAGRSEWNSDLVLGPPAPGHSPSAALEPVPVSMVQIAIEIKSVMTEHRKNIKNRKRDFEAHHEHVHNFDNNAIAGALLVVNASEQFKSPLRQTVTEHKNPLRLIEHCVSEMRSVAIRGGSSGYGLEAKAVVVVDHANDDESTTTYLESTPAPQVGDPMHYDAFIGMICNCYRQRFA